MTDLQQYLSGDINNRLGEELQHVQRRRQHLRAAPIDQVAEARELLRVQEGRLRPQEAGCSRCGEEERRQEVEEEQVAELQPQADEEHRRRANQAVAQVQEEERRQRQGDDEDGARREDEDRGHPSTVQVLLLDVRAGRQ